MKRAVVLMITILMAISLCGCNYVTMNIEAVISPPKMTEQQADIYKALEASIRVGKNINLKYPKTGDYRSAIVIRDIDSEGTEEALVFYESNAQSAMGKAGVSICLLDQIEGEWKTIWDIPGTGTDVDKVLFMVDKQTEEKFIVVGFTMGNQIQKTYRIYNYTQGEFRLVFTDSYQVLEVCDMNKDGQDELVTVSRNEQPESKGTLSKVTTQTFANIIEYKDGNFVKVSETPLMGKAVEYTNITKNAVSFDTPALFLDEFMGGGIYGTEILIVQDGQLKNLIFDPSAQIDLYQNTLRTQIPTCSDMNGDGIVEIPQVSLFPGYSEKDENPLYTTQWYQLSEGEFVLTSTTYINYAQGYGFVLPDEWIGQVSAKSIVEDDEVVFFAYAGDVNDDRKKIMSIKVDTQSNLRTGGIPDGYVKVMTVGQLVFLARNHHLTAEEFKISNEQIIDHFIDLHVLGD